MSETTEHTEPTESDALNAEGDLIQVREGYRSGFVAFVGPPNVGKSTLINSILLTDLFSVTPVPQTTRQPARAILSSDDAQIVLVDTPGVTEFTSEFHRRMLTSALAAAEDADVVCLLYPAGKTPDHFFEVIAEFLSTRGKKAFCILTKTDLAKGGASGKPFGKKLPVLARTSAKTQTGVTELIAALSKELPEGPPLYPEDIVSDRTERELAADWIREAALNQLQQEVPHAIAIDVRGFKDRRDGASEIDADIHVETPSQKGIVIGKGGQRLKEIGQEARESISRRLGRKVHLRLWVRVSKNWRKRGMMIRQFGPDISTQRHNKIEQWLEEHTESES